MPRSRLDPSFMVSLQPSYFDQDNLCEHLQNQRVTLSFKEVIQPQVPLGLPCYDFTPVMNHSVVSALPKVRLPLLVQPTPMV